MALTAKFPGATFERLVTGYRISTCLRPGIGFGDDFYVYVCVRADPRKNPGSIHFKADAVPRGTLQLAGGSGVEYTFPDLDLVGVDVFANQAQRTRVLEFRYDRDVSGESTFKPTLANNSARKVERARLGRDFEFKLGEEKESLLAFASRQTPQGAAAFRFSSLANNAGNSWLTKILELKNDWHDFEIPVGDLRLKVLQDAVDRIYVDESYGDMLNQPLPGLLSMINADQTNQVVRFASRAESAEDLLRRQLDDRINFNVGVDVVQTATFVFKHGSASELAVC